MTVFFYGYIASFILGIINYEDINLSTTLLGIIIFFISPFINTILIFFFGNTLGKKILGIKILELNNIKASPIRILKREFWVYVKGMGLGIPFIGFITIFLSYCDLIDDQITSWDKQMNFKIIYRTQKLWITVVTRSLIVLLYLSTLFINLLYD